LVQLRLAGVLPLAGWPSTATAVSDRARGRRREHGREWADLALLGWAEKSRLRDVTEPPNLMLSQEYSSFIRP
jgi:hypothetical protein